MDKIILGILMLKRLTIYEIRGIIKRNFKAMCSDSLGSIQAAIKKLLAQEMVTCREYVEKSVNKKRYSITDKGRNAFLDWLCTPGNLSTSKNLSKLLFMGLIPEEERLSLVGESIKLMEKELSELLEVQGQASVEREREQMIAYWEEDLEYLSGIQNATGAAHIAKSAEGIGEFQMLTLQYGIDLTRFQIDWFRELEKKIRASTLTS